MPVSAALLLVFSWAFQSQSRFLAGLAEQSSFQAFPWLRFHFLALFRVFLWLELIYFLALHTPPSVLSSALPSRSEHCTAGICIHHSPRVYQPSPSLDCINLRIHFHPQLLEVLINAFPVLPIWFGPQWELSYLFDQFAIFWDRPMTKHCLAVALQDLLDQQHILSMQSLINDADFAFNDKICVSLISAYKETFLACMEWAHPCIISELSKLLSALKAFILELSVHLYLWRSSNLCFLLFVRFMIES